MSGLGRIGRSIFSVVSAVAIFASGRDVRALDGNLRTHDPSTVIICDGKYYDFATGNGMPFITSEDGWTWARGGTVFQTIPSTVHDLVPLNNGRQVWAPDIIKVNGEYYLYYSVSSWGSFVSAVGLLTSPTLDPKDPKYKWTDKGMIVNSVEGEKPDLNAIDPGVMQAPDGTLWLTYGSYHGTIRLVELDPKTGLRIRKDSPITTIASKSEASTMIYHDGYYYLMVNHGSCCKGADSTYNINAGRSKKVTGPFLDAKGVDLANGGGTLFLGTVGKQIGPGHFGLLVDRGVEKFSCHYEADQDKGGGSMLDIRPLLWTADGWPKAGENAKAGEYAIQSAVDKTLLRFAGNGKTVIAATGDHAQQDQQWKLADAGGGCFFIVSSSGQALEAPPQAGAISTALLAKTDKQIWYVDQTSDGSYRIMDKAKTVVLTSDAKIGLSAAPYKSTDAAQKWIFVPVVATTNPAASVKQ